MKRGNTITLAHKSDATKETKSVEAPIIKQKGGLAVHLTMTLIGVPDLLDKDKLYCLSHIKSGGRVVPMSFESKARAIRALNAFCELEIDWTMNWEGIHKATRNKEIQEKIRQAQQDA